jgi:hypothetical protein
MTLFHFSFVGKGQEVEPVIRWCINAISFARAALLLTTFLVPSAAMTQLVIL